MLWTESVTEWVVMVACGHAAGYLLAQAATSPDSVGKLCLLSPTWRGPLPTMLRRRPELLRKLSGLVDFPGVGALFYRLNVNSQMIRMMSRGNVYKDPLWFSFKTFGQFCRKGLEFLFVHNLSVSAVRVNISKTGNYTILITVSFATVRWEISVFYLNRRWIYPSPE